jgi:hypothetical protein
MAFFDAGAIHREPLFLAGNRVRIDAALRRRQLPVIAHSGGIEYHGAFLEVLPA